MAFYLGLQHKVGWQTTADKGWAWGQVGMRGCGLRERDGVIYPTPLFSNISQHPSLEGNKVSEHFQTGPGGGYVLQRQTQPQSFSPTKILKPRGLASVSAELVAYVPRDATVFCLTQVFHLDTKHFTPSSPSLPRPVFKILVYLLWQEGGLRQSGWKPCSLNAGASVCPSVPAQVDASRHMSIISTITQS